MKLVTLCKAGSCCPVVKIKDSQVEIGEVYVVSESGTLRPLELAYT